MTNRILRDPAFGLGLLVWVVAATLLPFQLGLTGATLLALVAYLAVAGALLATADAVLNPAFYRDWSDVGLQSVFWMISLSLPAGLLFALGAASAPANDTFGDDLCRMAGLSHLEGHPEDALEEALEPTEDCEVEG